jgi:hypothetical protein
MDAAVAEKNACASATIEPHTKSCIQRIISPQSCENLKKTLKIS